MNNITLVGRRWLVRRKPLAAVVSSFHNHICKRTYMDVHKRPSHSRMFDRPGNRIKQTTPATSHGTFAYPIRWGMIPMAAAALYCCYSASWYNNDSPTDNPQSTATRRTD